MFTSRAEYRLLLRQDNADLRLSEIGHGIGLLSNENYRLFLKKCDSITREISRLNQIRVGPDTMAHLLKKTEISYEDLPDKDDSLPFEVRQAVEIEIKYAGYISRQKKEVEQHKSSEKKTIPVDFDYDRIRGLSTEAQGKLAKIRPISLGQAGRISGVSPADVSLLAVWLKRYVPANEKASLHSSSSTDNCSEV